MRLVSIAAVGLASALFAASVVSAKPIPHLTLKWPICSGLYAAYGWRIDEFTGRQAFHSGVDLAGNYGDIVRAAAPGRVISAELRGPYGLTVETDNGHELRMRYGHFSTLLVQEGDYVKAGQPIGQIGATGRVKAPHLHFEVWLGDVVHDPLNYLPRSAGCIPDWPDGASTDPKRPPPPGTSAD